MYVTYFFLGRDDRFCTSVVTFLLGREIVYEEGRFYWYVTPSGGGRHGGIF